MADIDIMHSDTMQSSTMPDPEEEAFRALKLTICRICKKRDITSKDDERLIEMVDRYKDRYPLLTPALIQDELDALNANAPIDQFEMISSSSDASALTRSTYRHLGKFDSKYGFDVHDTTVQQVEYNTHSLHSGMSHGNFTSYNYELRDEGEPAVEEEPMDEGTGYWATCKRSVRENNFYNPLTYAFVLTIFATLMFAISVLYTFYAFNHGPNRDWALAGGVTSTSAQFRVRGPSSDDGKRREFVVSVNPNLAIEKDQILNVAVSFNDFAEDEHQVKRLGLETLTPNSEYYYGITRPQRAPNSAVVAGEVGKFRTPVAEGTRMDFTLATGSCALTGSKSKMFESVLDLDPMLFIHMGDFHYEDLETLDVDERLEAYDKVMGSPSQRLLYMNTIFAYIWDDHDWLGNNRDSEDEDAAAIAKQAYTLGIPHYELGSTSTNEADAAKYQAFTIGTVRFVITDLRSESIKSSEYYSGKVYSKEQKQWLYDEFSRADEYDFVVWVTTRPWTDPDEFGSDSWGGFVPDRDELAAHIASTIGAGPRNLLVLSGDNHMVAFDDGSNTDYSGQVDVPGGFPLLHSGPLTNMGSDRQHYFTDGCMAYNFELNYQFSTVDFYFSKAEGDSSEQGCIRLRSYSGDATNIIFEKEMCGEIMKRGTQEENTCTLEKLSVPTQTIFIVAAALVSFSGLLALFYLGFNRGHLLALSYFGIGGIFYFATIAAAGAGAFCFGTRGVNMLSVSILLALQAFAGSLFVGNAIYEEGKNNDKEWLTQNNGRDDVEASEKSPEKDNESEMKTTKKGEEDTHSTPGGNADKENTDSLERAVMVEKLVDNINSKESNQDSDPLVVEDSKQSSESTPAETELSPASKIDLETGTDQSTSTAQSNSGVQCVMEPVSIIGSGRSSSEFRPKSAPPFLTANHPLRAQRSQPSVSSTSLPVESPLICCQAGGNDQVGAVDDDDSEDKTKSAECTRISPVQETANYAKPSVPEKGPAILSVLSGKVSSEKDKPIQSPSTITPRNTPDLGFHEARLATVIQADSCSNQNDQTPGSEGHEGEGFEITDAGYISKNLGVF